MTTAELRRRPPGQLIWSCAMGSALGITVEVIGSFFLAIAFSAGYIFLFQSVDFVESEFMEAFENLSQTPYPLFATTMSFSVPLLAGYLAGRVAKGSGG